jgi:hypothetical protein
MPLSAAMGVRISWLASATNRRCAASMRRCSVTSESSSTAPSTSPSASKSVVQFSRTVYGPVSTIRAVLSPSRPLRTTSSTPASDVSVVDRRVEHVALAGAEQPGRFGVDHTDRTRRVERHHALGHRLDDRRDLAPALLHRTERLTELDRHAVVGEREVLHLVGDETRGNPLLEVALGDGVGRHEHPADAATDQVGEREAEQAGDDERDPEAHPDPVAHGIEDAQGVVDGACEDDRTLPLAGGAEYGARGDRPAVGTQVGGRVGRGVGKRGVAGSGERGVGRRRVVGGVDERAGAVVDPDARTVDAAVFDQDSGDALATLLRERELRLDPAHESRGVAHLGSLGHLGERSLQSR